MVDPLIQMVLDLHSRYLLEKSRSQITAALADVLFFDLADGVKAGLTAGRARKLRDLSERVDLGHDRPTSVAQALARMAEQVLSLETFTADNKSLARAKVLGPTAAGRGDTRRGEYFLTIHFVKNSIDVQGSNSEDSRANKQIFVCHASEDKQRVRSLCELLRRAGHTVWFDEEALLPGDEWELEIRRAIRKSDIVVACLSKQSVTKRGFVQRELRFALDVADEQPEGSVFIVPVKLEPCNVPDRLERWQWLAMYERGAIERLLRGLARR